MKRKRLIVKLLSFWRYCAGDVWRDTRRSRWVNVIKTLNLSVRSCLNHDIQSQACAMTYRTLLAIVPALALIFAIGRGFGLQETLQEELFRIFPAQHQAVNYALKFVDSYLNQSSEGVFVGVGILFLLWTLISLISNVEDSFNSIWCVKQGRSFTRKITDYTAMLLILPIIMICAGGLSLMLTSVVRTIFDFDFLTPVVYFVLEGMSWVMTWLFFAALFILLPNTKVKFANAFMAGIFTGSGFLILQWIFVSGQMYVARYNAIYGSFSFLPLMLIWLQLTWVVILAGAVICYSSQNIFMYNFDKAINNMSSSYYSRIVLAICALVVQDFVDGKGATVANKAVKKYNLPPRLVTLICDKLVKAHVLSVVEVDPKHDIMGYQPAIDPTKITVAEVYKRLDDTGTSDFIPHFATNFPGVIEAYRKIYDNEYAITSEMLLTDIKINEKPRSTYQNI